MGGVVTIFLASLLALGPSPFSEETAPSRSEKSLVSPGGATVGSELESAFVLKAANGEGEATLWHTKIWDPKPEEGGLHFRTQLKASIPFDLAAEESVEIGSLSGLNAGARFSFEIGGVSWKGTGKESDTSLPEACDEYVASLIPGYTYRHVAVLEDVQQGCSLEGLKGRKGVNRLQGAVDAINEKRRACSEQEEPDALCAVLGEVPHRARLVAKPMEVAKDKWPELRAVLEKLPRPMQLWTIGVSTSRQQFEYVVPAAPADVQERAEQGWALSVAYTRIHRGTLWSFALTEEEAFRAGPRRDICTAFGGTGALSCAERSVAGPTSANSTRAFGEYRGFLGAGIAISPRVEFDLDESRWGMRVPVYFVTGDDGRLLAGVAVGWEEEEELGAAVFVGRRFGGGLRELLGQ